LFAQSLRPAEIVVVDQGASCVKVFEPTRFMRTVLEAVSLFSKGRYDEAEDSWQTILKSHESYTLANMGMAKAKYKQGDYAAAMAYYRLCDDADGYSQAFTKYRHQVFREHFAPIVALGAGVIALAAALIWLMLAFIRRHIRRYGHPI
jgi:tetratricopeptide (TPR) repeat protein